MSDMFESLEEGMKVSDSICHPLTIPFRKSDEQRIIRLREHMKTHFKNLVFLEFMRRAVLKAVDELEDKLQVPYKENGTDT